MTVDPQVQLDFALEVVRQLRAAGHLALWAGGCVRDRLLGKTPKDYDVATAATPPQITQVFGKRRTLQVGAAFGVVIVLGPEQAGQIDVATFRQDLTYSDGRRPDQIKFSSPEADAQRRDFTINGLFFDPVEQRVIDFVGGAADLEQGVVRAIGDPEARFDEDKLRMLRAARFTATYGFVLDPATAAAIRRRHAQLAQVSAERITQEMRAMLQHPQRAWAVRVLDDLRLLPEILPEFASQVGTAAGERSLEALTKLEGPSLPLALATLLADADGEAPVRTAHLLGRRWKLPVREIERLAWLLEQRERLADAAELAWPVLQRVLIAPGIEELLALHTVRGGATAAAADVAHCRQRLALPAEQLNPVPLLTGDDLIAHGVPRGQRYKTLLDQVRDAQLLGTVRDRAAALALVDQLLADGT